MLSPAAILAIFTAERRRFAAVYPRVAEARLALVRGRCPEPPCRARDHADSSWSDGIIRLARRALDLPTASVVGLLRHELGHLADPTPDAPEAEARADAIAHYVTGEPVRYDARGLQTVGAGGKRPRVLHR